MSGSSPTKEIDWKLLGYLFYFFGYEKTITPEENVLTIYNIPAPNDTNIKIDYIDVATNGTENVMIRIYVNPQVGGIVTYVAVPNSTIAEYDVTGTTVTGNDIRGIYCLSDNNDRHIDLRELNIILTPGDTFVISAESAAASDVMVSVGWTERF